MVAELVVVNENMVVDAETLAQLLEVVTTTGAAAIAAREERSGSRHDGSGGRGARHQSEKGLHRVQDFDGQNWKEWNFQFKVALNNARPQVFHLVTKVERAERGETMVDIATLEAASRLGTDGGGPCRYRRWQYFLQCTGQVEGRRKGRQRQRTRRRQERIQWTVQQLRRTWPPTVSVPEVDQSR